MTQDSPGCNELVCCRGATRSSPTLRGNADWFVMRTLDVGSQNCIDIAGGRPGSSYVEESILCQ